MASEAHINVAVIVLDHQKLQHLEHRLDGAAHLIWRAWRDAPTGAESGGYLDLIEAVRALRESMTELISEAKHA